jgi:hypothetical protein
MWLKVGKKKIVTSLQQVVDGANLNKLELILVDVMVLYGDQA